LLFLLNAAGTDMLPASGSGSAPGIKDTGPFCHVRVHVTPLVFFPASTPAEIISPQLGDFSVVPGAE